MLNVISSNVVGVVLACTVDISSYGKGSGSGRIGAWVGNNLGFYRRRKRENFYCIEGKGASSWPVSDMWKSQLDSRGCGLCCFTSTRENGQLYIRGAILTLYFFSLFEMWKHTIAEYHYSWIRGFIKEKRGTEENGKIIWSQKNWVLVCSKPLQSHISGVVRNKALNIVVSERKSQ